MSTSATTNPESYKIHEEKVSDFYIAWYEVTVGLYEKVTGKNPTSSRDKDRPVDSDFARMGIRSAGRIIAL